MSGSRQRQLLWSQLRVGVMVIIAVIAVSLFVFFIDEVRAGLETRYTLYFHTLTTQTLRPRAQVWLAGQRVGRVEALQFEPPTRDRTERLQVSLSVSTDARPYITEGAVAQVINAGLLGEAVVNILPARRPGQPLERFGVLPTAPELDPGQVAERLTALIDSLRPVAVRWREVQRQARSGDGTLGRLAGDPRTLQVWQSHLDEMTDVFGAVSSIADGLSDELRSPAARAALRRIFSRFSQLAERWEAGGGSAGALARDTLLARRLERIEGRAKEIRARLESGRGTAGRFLYDRALPDELEETRAMLRALRRDLAAALGGEEPPP